MKVAILHDWLLGFRGGERMLEAFLEMYPEAEIYTLIHDPGSTSPLIESKKIHTTFLNKLPGVFKNYRYYLPLFPIAAQSIKLPKDIDLVISCSHCVIKGVQKPNNAKHLSYIYSPMRYIYDQFDAYFGKEKPLPIRLAAHLIRPYLQTWDYISNQNNIDLMVGISGFIKNRIELFYRRKAEVVYPFVDTKDFINVQMNPPRKEAFYLMVSAFAPNKRIDLAISAFNQLDEQLIIVGGGQDEVELRKMANQNIRFMGQLSRTEIVDLMSKARGFIFPGIEDFGIAPLEALAAGTPVIAYFAGGVAETLNKDVAHFFYEQTPEALVQALKSFNPEKFKNENLFARANMFSKAIFQKNISSIIDDKLFR